MSKSFAKIGIMAGGAAALVLMAPGCANLKSFLAVGEKADRAQPISNPFGTYYSEGHSSPKDNIVLRTKKGDRSIEVELPGGTADMTDFTIPMSPSFRDSTSGGRGLASVGDPSQDLSYKDKRPSITDREITRNFPQGLPEDEGKRREIETGLGVIESEDSAPVADYSYLAALDHIKQLYKSARYEVALLEIDELIRAYPTDPKLYLMRGTLLDRLGRLELAVRSWNQALRFDPANQPLRRFIERKQQRRGLASP